MLLNQTLDQLHRLRLNGMADAFAQQLQQPDTHALSFEERFSLLVDRELTERENRRLTRLLQLARLKQQACVEDIDYKHRRGLERSLMATLVTGDWIRAHHNLHLMVLPAPASPGSLVPWAIRPVARVSRFAMNESRACSMVCASRAVMAPSPSASHSLPRRTSSSSTTLVSKRSPRVNGMTCSKSLRTVTPLARH